MVRWTKLKYQLVSRGVLYIFESMIERKKGNITNSCRIFPPVKLKTNLPFLSKFQDTLPPRLYKHQKGGEYIYRALLISIVADFSAALAITFYITGDSTAL